MATTTKRRIVVLDTSMLTVHLRVPGHVTCGTSSDRWDANRVDAHLAQRLTEGAWFVLPLATLIETARHISQAPALRHELATTFVTRVQEALQGTTPWVPFSHQHNLWDAKSLGALVERWPSLALRRMSLADASISEVATFYSKLGHSVEILTGDKGLKSMEPAPPSRVPRRRR